MKTLLLMVISFFFYTNLFAQGEIINVPGDHSTIQAAINASVDGDTVLVANGTYYENIDFMGKAITIASWFLVDGNEIHIDSTIINGSQPLDPNDGTVVVFQSNEDTTSVLCGFTITGGTGSTVPGAVHEGWGGGGIGLGGPGLGGGAKIIHNKIIHNSVIAPNPFAYGGGIIIDEPTNDVIIEYNEISHNQVIALDQNEHSSEGGGIFVYAVIHNTEVLIANNIISHNIIKTPDGIIKGRGGGISIAHSSDNVIVRNNLIHNNKVYKGGGIAYLVNTDNNSQILVNNTIANNHATKAGGGIYSWDSSPSTATNCIISGNTPEASQIYIELSAEILLDYSLIEGGYIGTGNIDQNPLFADTVNYYLTSSSPCVDAGNPGGFFNDLIDPNNPGFPLFPALGGIRNDMGAYGGNPYMIKTYTPNSIIRSCVLNNTYHVPSIDTLIVTSEIFSPENQLVNVQAIIESYDGSERDSIQMYDDGTHNDNIEGDGFYTAFWPVINYEEDFQIHISTYLSDYQYSVLLKNAASFSTKGPIMFEDLSITSNDTIPNPGDRIRISITLKNLGITDTVYNVCAWIIITDTTISDTKRGILKFGDIAPGESLTNWSRDFELTINDSCDPSSYEFGLEIISKEVYWRDTFSINVVPTGIDDEQYNLPKEFALEQNYPNPFNPSTTIKYEIPGQARNDNMNVALKVYDILGREVAELVNQQQKPGYYEVQFTSNNGLLTSGVYFYKLTAGNFVETKKMILLR